MAEVFQQENWERFLFLRKRRGGKTAWCICLFLFVCLSFLFLNLFLFFYLVFFFIFERVPSFSWRLGVFKCFMLVLVPCRDVFGRGGSTEKDLRGGKGLQT